MHVRCECIVHVNELSGCFHMMVVGEELLASVWLVNNYAVLYMFVGGALCCTASA